MHPQFQIYLPFSEKFSDSVENFPNFTFPREISRFSSTIYLFVCLNVLFRYLGRVLDFKSMVEDVSLIIAQGRPQAGARWCTCTPLDFDIQVFAEHYPCTVSDTETPSISFLQSEILQQVLVFHK